MQRLSFTESWRERIKTPKYVLLEAMPPTCEFSIFGPTKYPPYIAVPMESGKTGLFKYLGVETPRDPGDQHFHRWAFVKYLKGGKQ